MKWYVNKCGYLVTTVWKPESRRKDKVLQHRLVWEIYRGPIPKDAIIHHKNGITTDNKIENLELLPSQGAHLTHHYKQEKALGIVRHCQFCQQDFVAFRAQKYCSPKCRDGAARRKYRDRIKATYRENMKDPAYRQKRCEIARRYRARQKAA